MKKKILLFLCTLMAASVFAAEFKKGSKAYVSTKTVALKSSTGLGAKTVSTLSYGDQVKIISISGKKIQVQLTSNSKVNGWIPANSLTSKKITKTSSGGTVSASTKELALAGKGFTEETEEVYSAADGDIDFTMVDAIESIKVEDSDLYAFINDGHLQGAD